MTSMWQIKSLGEVCRFERGLTYTKGDEVERSNNGVLRANNIDLETNTLVLNEIRYISDDIAVPNLKKVSKDSLIICIASGSKSHLGKVAFIDKELDYAFGGFMGQITPSSSLYPKFLFYVMRTQPYKEFINSLTNGMNINNLKYNDLKNYCFSVPPRVEQQSIVALLDKAFEGIDTAVASAEKNLANARELFDSYLQRIFSGHEKGWAKSLIMDVCNRVTVGHVGTMAERYKLNGIPFLRSQNIRPFEINMDNITFIDNEFNSELKKSQLCPGDLAIVRTGYPGTAAVIPPWLTEANCSDLVIIRPSQKVSSYYLEAFFNSDSGKKLVFGKLVGSAQKHFNVKAAKEAVIHYPDVAKQTSIVEKIKELRIESERLELLYKGKLVSLADLKRSILQKAFAGELSTRSSDPTQEAAE